MEPKRVTVCPEANDQLLYFTSTSLLADDRRLVVISDRTGHPNLFLVDTESGNETQLTFNDEGMLKSYVYFDGTPNKGFGKASVSLHPQSGTVYYIQGREIRAVDTNGQSRIIAEYPHDQMTAFTHVSTDGKYLCVPTTDARALDGVNQLKGKPDYNIDGRVQEENLSSYLRVYNTETGAEILCEEVPKSWITHVQFSPTNHEHILYNHEWPSDCGIRRVWLWNGNEHIRLRDESENRSRNDWTCHEMWERNGQYLIYHGGYKNGPAFIGRVKPNGTDRIEIALPENWTQYGHFTVGNPNHLVSDGYYRQNDDPEQRSGVWITRQHVDWKNEHIDWTPLCRSGSSWDSQDSHPHPIYNHAANAIYFTSDRDGKRAVYRIEAPPNM
ncbi:MAG: oligogalacturonate lyase family protein [Candidatus Latescibacteria bacterium]|jgi:hypothetical protein|nr:oligogalacturonate lyase family protein [Candidatus Latescibacterota bacterium]